MRPVMATGPVPNQPPQPPKPGKPSGSSSRNPAPSTPTKASGSSSRNAVPKAGAPAPKGPPPKKNMLEAHREALGLSSAKPSDMVAGLEDVAKRAGAREDRAKARVEGGRIADKAVLTDGTGQRWERRVLLGIILVALLVGGTLGVMYFLANKKVADPREQKMETHNRLLRLQTAISSIAPFGKSEVITAEMLKERLRNSLQAALKEAEATAEKEKTSRGMNTSTTQEQLKHLKQDQDFKDVWDKDLVFEVEGNEVSISSTTPDVKPVKVVIPRK